MVWYGMAENSVSAAMNENTGIYYNGLSKIR